MWLSSDNCVYEQLAKTMAKLGEPPCAKCESYEKCKKGYACTEFYNWHSPPGQHKFKSPNRVPDRVIFAYLFPYDFPDVEDLKETNKETDRLRKKLYRGVITQEENYRFNELRAGLKAMTVKARVEVGL